MGHVSPVVVLEVVHLEVLVLLHLFMLFFIVLILALFLHLVEPFVEFHVFQTRPDYLPLKHFLVFPVLKILCRVFVLHQQHFLLVETSVNLCYEISILRKSFDVTVHILDLFLFTRAQITLLGESLHQF